MSCETLLLLLVSHSDALLKASGTSCSHNLIRPKQSSGGSRWALVNASSHMFNQKARIFPAPVWSAEGFEALMFHFTSRVWCPLGSRWPLSKRRQRKRLLHICCSSLSCVNVTELHRDIKSMQVVPSPAAAGNTVTMRWHLHKYDP